MRTKYRFIEGYRGNDTVRGWRDFDSIYHAVFADMRGSRGYPKGKAVQHRARRAAAAAGDSLRRDLRRDGTYGPKANFKISVRELPDDGRFRVTVTAAKYRDGLLLDRDAKEQPRAGTRWLSLTRTRPRTVTIPKAGIYQVDVHRGGRNNRCPGRFAPERGPDGIVA